MNTIIEKIRAEIERQEKQCPLDTYEGRHKLFILGGLKTRLSDLEKEEKPSEGLEEEITKWFAELDKKYGVTIDFGCADIESTACHFYELGRQSNPKVCEGLYDFMKKRSESLYFHDDFEIASYKKGVVEGVQWQKEQMMKDAVTKEGKFKRPSRDASGLGYLEISTLNTPFKEGDEVIIQIRKKES